MNIEYHTLTNGLRLVLLPHPDSKVVHSGLFINAGTRDEPEGRGGLAHYIEHGLFKGTKKRKPFHVINRLESVGGELNAYTSKEETVIYASVLSEHLDRALELISDVAFHSSFSDVEMKKEKEVIIDEIKAYQDSPAEQIYDDFEGQLLRSHPLGNPILGTEESVKALKRTDIQNFIRAQYVPNEMVLSLCGKFESAKALALINKYFAAQKAGKANTRIQAKARLGAITKSEARNVHQAHAIMGSVAPSYRHARKRNMILLNNILGGAGMNSRLNMVVREKYGYSYTIDSSYHTYSDAGVFNIYLSCDEGFLQKSLDLVHKEIDKLRTQRIGTMQLSQAKKQLIGQYAMGMENKLKVMMGAGKSVLVSGQVSPFETVVKKIEHISATDLMETANLYMATSKLSTLVFKSF